MGSQKEGFKFGEAEVLILPTTDQPLEHGALVLLARLGEGAEVDEGLQQQVVNILVVLHNGLEYNIINRFIIIMCVHNTK